MELNRNTDVIRRNNTDYVNLQTGNSLIKEMIARNAEDAYAFGIVFGKHVDANVAKEMEGTYWISNGLPTEYEEDVQIAVL